MTEKQLDRLITRIENLNERLWDTVIESRHIETDTPEYNRLTEASSALTAAAKVLIRKDLS